MAHRFRDVAPPARDPHPVQAIVARPRPMAQHLSASRPVRYLRGVVVELRTLTESDIQAHCAGEDEATVRWLTGGYGTVSSTRAHFERLAANAAAGRGKRGFGVWLDGRLAGYVDCDPDDVDGLVDGEVNISYATHPWARGLGLATEAVEQICRYITTNHLGTTAVIRAESANRASIRVAEKAGFRPAGEIISTGSGAGEDATVYRVYRRHL